MIAVYMRISVEDRGSTGDELSMEDGTTVQRKKRESNSISHQRNYILSYIQPHEEVYRTYKSAERREEKQDMVVTIRGQCFAKSKLLLCAILRGQQAPKGGLQFLY